MTKEEIALLASEGLLNTPIARDAFRPDDKEAGYYLIFHRPDGPDVQLFTARGKLRVFKTLDAVSKFLVDVGFCKFEVELFGHGPEGKKYLLDLPWKQHPAELTTP